MTQIARRSLGSLIAFGSAFIVCAYFAFAAIQGDFGLLRRIEIRADIAALSEDKAALSDELFRMTNLTHRLSDDYLDIDLLDQQARDVLGYLRVDELVLR
jgi:cell division protein FtsB